MNVFVVSEQNFQMFDIAEQHSAGKLSSDRSKQC